MNTTFILHGGNPNIKNSKNESFFSEIMKSFDLRLITVLLVYFAKDGDEYEQMKFEDEDLFRRATPNFVQFNIALEDILEEQIKESNIIYLHGGDTMKLLEVLKKYPKLKNMLEDKMVVGESAGAYVLSRWFYSKSAKGLHEGLGFVPTATICHYDGKNEEKLKEVLDNDSKLEKLLLKDGEYRVF